MSITTKTGDKGYTSVASRRVKKDSKIIEAIGTIDELQAIIEEVEIQKDLYEIMGEIAVGKISNLEFKILNLKTIIVYLNRLSDYFYLLSRQEEE